MVEGRETDPLVARVVENDVVNIGAVSTSKVFTARAMAGAIAGLLMVGTVTRRRRQHTASRSIKLGDVTLDCPKGIFQPENRGPNEKFTILTVGISKYADNIFIICTDECDMSIPEEFENKVTMLNGYELDKCNSIEGLDHWVKTSQAHLVAVYYALSKDSQLAMIMEQDTMTDPKAGWADGNWQQLNEALDTHEWFMLRLGYRPITFELNPEIEACPQECRCENVGEMLCWLQSAGCDLRASDAYLLHRRGMEHYASALSTGDVIDNGVLQRVPNQLLVTPQINFQMRASSDFTSVEHQNDVQALFMERCNLGLSATQARAALAATLGGKGGGGNSGGVDAAVMGVAGGQSDPSYEELAKSSEVISTESGEPITVLSAVAAFGGVEKVMQSKRRLGLTTT